MNIPFKKGVLEMCVLLMLQQRNSYGYDIANQLSRTISISDGTVYPILRRLKQDGYVSSYLKSPGGVTLATPTGTPVRWKTTQIKAARERKRQLDG